MWCGQYGMINPRIFYLVLSKKIDDFIPRSGKKKTTTKIEEKKGVFYGV